MGAASRTHTPDLAREMLKLLRVEGKRALDYFDWVQIYPGILVVFLVLCSVLWFGRSDFVGLGSKTTHFTKLQKQSGLAYGEMLFFDDEARNKNVEEKGVVMCLVEDGVTRDVVDRGVREWRRRKGRDG